MPNYIYSTLTLNGSSNDIKTFRAKFEDKGKLQATNVIPYPKEFELLDKKNDMTFNKYGEVVVKLSDEEEIELTLMGLEGKYDMNKEGYSQGGYNWCIKNWGTKWGFCDCSVEENEDGLVYSFSTAWSPISIVIDEMSKQFPKITFNYFCDEESGDFRDDTEYLNGKVTDYYDRSHECVEERKQMEDDYKLEQEEDKRIEDKLKENKNGQELL